MCSTIAIGQGWPSVSLAVAAVLLSARADLARAEGRIVSGVQGRIIEGEVLTTSSHPSAIWYLSLNANHAPDGTHGYLMELRNLSQTAVETLDSAAEITISEVLMVGDVLFVREGATLTTHRSSRDRRAHDTTGTQDVLVVRLKDAANRQSASTKAALSDAVFGTAGDVHNIKSQYHACSYGALTIQPLTAPGVVNGVVDVSIDLAVQGLHVGSSQLVNEIRAKLGALPNGILETAERVMVCMPPGATFNGGPWIGFGFFNE